MVARPGPVGPRLGGEGPQELGGEQADSLGPPGQQPARAPDVFVPDTEVEAGDAEAHHPALGVLQQARRMRGGTDQQVPRGQHGAGPAAPDGGRTVDVQGDIEAVLGIGSGRRGEDVDAAVAAVTGGLVKLVDRGFGRGGFGHG